MSRRIITFVALLLIGITQSTAQTGTTGSVTKKKNQTAGFYGKRFTLQLGVGFHHNSFLKLASDKEKFLRERSYYRHYRKEINKDHFNYSFYGNMGVVLKEQIALSLDFHYYKGDIFLQDIGKETVVDQWGNSYVKYGIHDARVKYNTIRIMPRIEIGSSGSNVPTGLVNIFGLGVELSKLKSGDYRVITNQNSYPDSVIISTENIRFRDDYCVNLTFMYGLEYRLPISKNIAWNFGGYTHVNLPVQLLFSELVGSMNYYGEEDYRIQLSKYRFQNFFSLRTGLVIML